MKTIQYQVSEYDTRENLFYNVCDQKKLRSTYPQPHQSLLGQYGATTTAVSSIEDILLTLNHTVLTSRQSIASLVNKTLGQVFSQWGLYKHLSLLLFCPIIRSRIQLKKLFSAGFETGQRNRRWQARDDLKSLLVYDQPREWVSWRLKKLLLHVFCYGVIFLNASRNLDELTLVCLTTQIMINSVQC